MLDKIKILSEVCKLKVSIITICLNSKEFIASTIESVLMQSYKNIEYIVIDGESTDGTLEIIKKYVGSISKYVSEKDKGIYDAMNKGVLLASGDIIGFLNADDIFYDNTVIQRIVSAFTNDSTDSVYGNLVYVNRQDAVRITRRWKSKEFRDGLFEKSWTPAHPTFYCKRALYKQLGFYRTDFKIAADVELMYRFLQKYHIRSKYIDADFVRMRDSGVSNRGIQSTIIITREMKKAINENGGHFNLVKYLFFKFLKINEFLKAYGKR
jgi:glycosyltransferase involved in cell wall biosynthesis